MHKSVLLPDSNAPIGDLFAVRYDIYADYTTSDKQTRPERKWKHQHQLQQPGILISFFFGSLRYSTAGTSDDDMTSIDGNLRDPDNMRVRNGEADAGGPKRPRV